MAPDIVSTRKRDHDAVMIWHRADDLPPNVCEGALPISGDDRKDERKWV